MSKYLITLLLLVMTLGGCSKPNPPTVNLYRAVLNGDIDQTERNLYWGAEVNAPDPDGQTVLHIAAKAGRLIIARMLLDNGADINALNHEGQSPLYIALLAGRTQLADVLVKRGAAFEAGSLLMRVVGEGLYDRDVFNFLTKHGASAGTTDRDGNTALHIASARGFRKIAKYFVDHGANVSAKNNEGFTPLALAEKYQQVDIINLLKEYGAAENGDRP